MSYYYKQNDREYGPVEERTVIAKLIDGEINSRTLIKDRYDSKYRMLLETDFNAVLGDLTSRWRYNIGALKREFAYLMISLAVWLVPLLLYLGGLFNAEIRSFLFHFGVMGIFGFFSFAGFFSSCYFTWMFAYRLWRVVPKSQYKITPGWRIMLTFVPFFRFGWNYCMWLPLAKRLRALTNYSMRTGKVAAHCYCTSIIVLTFSFFSVMILPWSYVLLNGTLHDELWKNILGCILLVLLIVSFGMTVVSFVVMAYKMEKAALAILRHRYAYNICMRTKDSLFLENTLKRQRSRDKVHRWGHGLGIGGVLVGWPLLLIGIPVLVLFIVGSCKYEKNMDKLETMGFPSSKEQLYIYNNVRDNAIEDMRNIHQKNDDEQFEKIFSHNNLAIPANWQNLNQIAAFEDVGAAEKVAVRLESKMQEALQSRNSKVYLELCFKYTKFLFWLLTSPVPEINMLGRKVLNDFLTFAESEAGCAMRNDMPVKEFFDNHRNEFISVLEHYTPEQLVIKTLLHMEKFKKAEIPFPPPEIPAEFWLHVYKKTPFMYFSENNTWHKMIKFVSVIKEKGLESADKKFDAIFNRKSMTLADDFISEEKKILSDTIILIDRIKKLK